MTDAGRPDPAPGRGEQLGEAVRLAAKYLDARVREERERGVTMAYGLVAGGGLSCAGGGSGHIYRVASMTKSFTAALVLGLRDGLVRSLEPLDLDRTLRSYLQPVIPAMARRDLRAITVRDALTMATGLPTDDPWADRLESLGRQEFAVLLDRDLVTNAGAGTAYEYSNLAYALLGALAEKVTGRTFRDLVHQEVLARFGLSESGLDYRALPADRLMPGFRRGLDGMRVPEPWQPPGAFSPIGGLLSTVADIARWMTVLMSALPAAEEGWARIFRDMQQAQRFYRLEQRPEAVAVESYGYGLHHRHEPVLGDILYHSGGYPGFGSHMRWHPASGTGVIVMGNTTYFDAAAPAREALGRITAAWSATNPAASPGTTPVAPKAARPLHPHPVPAEVRERMHQLETLIRSWSDAGADAIFSANMDLDMSRAERRELHARSRQRTGEAADAPFEVEFLSASQARWTVTGPAGTRTVTAKTDPFGLICAVEVETRSRDE